MWAENVASGRSFRVGDVVEIRSLNEILATLDARGSRDAMPFMPEMVPFCGRRFRVIKSAHKTCDPTGATNLRRIVNAVHLETRCDGSAHGGCQAGCLFFWHADWLKRAEGAPPKPANVVHVNGAKSASNLERLHAATRAADSTPRAVRYRCQLTEIIRFSTPISSLEPTQYVRDLLSGNVGLKDFVRYASIALMKGAKNLLVAPGLWSAAKRLLRRVRGRSADAASRPTSEIESARRLNLRPGERVRVRHAQEIWRTLDGDLKNRGLFFDADMWMRIGQVFPVAKRIERLIDEKTGRMLNIRKDSVVLQGVCCIGTHNHVRLFCPRGCLQFWRECWLERVEPDVGEAAAVRETPPKRRSRA
jgi:hypothetical protein